MASVPIEDDNFENHEGSNAIEDIQDGDNIEEWVESDNMEDSDKDVVESVPMLRSSVRNECTKIRYPDNILAYLEKRELDRDVEVVSCNDDLVEKVMLNYMNVKEILSNLRWQEKVLFKHVCTTWSSAVTALSREEMWPVDFVYYDLQSCRAEWFQRSSSYSSEPMAIFVFTNSTGLNMVSQCGNMTPCPCTPICENKLHSWMDFVYQQVTAPKNCMMTVVGSSLIYMPLAQSITWPHTRVRYHIGNFSPFLGGICLPMIPNVQFHMLNIKQKSAMNIDLQKDFYDVVDRLAADRIFKGVLIYVTEKYILQSVEDIIFLSYFKEKQPDVPYALGGCIVEDTMNEQKDIHVLIDRINKKNDFVSENLISIGIFTIPKTAITDCQEHGENYNFDMYSLVIESSEYSKPKIQQAINEFADKVPRFEHSVAMKLSCVGRDQKHEVEQDYFRSVFPHTPIIGCYGNGELGINHPVRPQPETPLHRAKRQRGDTETRSIIYSYSTVFVYMGWGKIIATKTPKNK